MRVSLPLNSSTNQVGNEFNIFPVEEPLFTSNTGIKRAGALSPLYSQELGQGRLTSDGKTIYIDPISKTLRYDDKDIYQYAEFVTPPQELDCDCARLYTENKSEPIATNERLIFNRDTIFELPFVLTTPTYLELDFNMSWGSVYSGQFIGNNNSLFTCSRYNDSTLHFSNTPGTALTVPVGDISERRLLRVNQTNILINGTQVIGKQAAYNSNINTLVIGGTLTSYNFEGAIWSFIISGDYPFQLVPIKSGQTKGSQTATANAFYDVLSDTIIYATVGEPEYQADYINQGTEDDQQYLVTCNIEGTTATLDFNNIDDDGSYMLDHTETKVVYSKQNRVSSQLTNKNSVVQISTVDWSINDINYTFPIAANSRLYEVDIQGNNWIVLIEPSQRVRLINTFDSTIQTLPDAVDGLLIGETIYFETLGNQSIARYELDIDTGNIYTIQYDWPDDVLDVSIYSQTYCRYEPFTILKGEKTESTRFFTSSINFNNDCYFEIPYKVNNNTEIECDFEYVIPSTPTTTNCILFGARDTTNMGVAGANAIAFVPSYTGNPGYFAAHYGSTVNTSITRNLNPGTRGTFRFADATFAINDSVIATFTPETFQGNYNLRIGGYNRAANPAIANNLFLGKIYSFKIREHGTLVHDLIPVSTNEVVHGEIAPFNGFYDQVTQEFIAPALGNPTTNVIVVPATSRTIYWWARTNGYSLMELTKNSDDEYMPTSDFNRSTDGSRSDVTQQFNRALNIASGITEVYQNGTKIALSYLGILIAPVGRADLSSWIADINVKHVLINNNILVTIGPHVAPRITNIGGTLWKINAADPFNLFDDQTELLEPGSLDWNNRVKPEQVLRFTDQIVEYRSLVQATFNSAVGANYEVTGNKGSSILVGSGSLQYRTDGNNQMFAPINVQWFEPSQILPLIDYYFSKDSTFADYQTTGFAYQKTELIGLYYPEPTVGTIMIPSAVNSDFNFSNSGISFSRWSVWNNIGIRWNYAYLDLYPLTSEVMLAGSLFAISGSDYLYDGIRVFQLTFTDGALTERRLVANTNGMTFVANDSTTAYFLSVDKYLWSFTGSFALNLVQDLTGTPGDFLMYSYNQNTDELILVFSEQTIAIRKGTIRQIPLKVDELQSINDGNIIVSDDINYLLNFSDGEPIDLDFDSGWVGIKDGDIVNFSKVWLKFKDKKPGTIQIDTFSDTFYTGKEIKFDDDELNIVPKQPLGRAIRIKLKGDLDIIAIDIEYEKKGSAPALTNRSK